MLDSLYRGHRSRDPRGRGLRAGRPARRRGDARRARPGLRRGAALRRARARRRVGREPRALLPRQRRRLAEPARRDARGRRHAARVLVDVRAPTASRRPSRSPRTSRRRRSTPTATRKLAVDRMLGRRGPGARARRRSRCATSTSAARAARWRGPRARDAPDPARPARRRRHAPTHVTILGHGLPDRRRHAIRDYIHVDDLARAHLLALENAEPGGTRSTTSARGTGLLGPPGDRDRAGGHRARDPGPRGGTSPRRPAAAGRRQQGVGRGSIVLAGSAGGGPGTQHRERVDRPPARVPAGRGPRLEVQVAPARPAVAPT